MDSSSEKPVLEALKIRKHFGAIAALESVTFSIGKGEVVGLVGDNGAGKSTLVKVITGYYSDYSGEIRLDGKSIHMGSPKIAHDLGIDVVHQDLGLSPNLSVRDNIFLGREIASRFKFIDYRSESETSRKILDQLNKEVDTETKVGSLSGGQRQLVAIARIMLRNPKIVFMDEPTSNISEHAAKEVLDLIRRLKSGGTSTILISHRLQEVLDVCDRILVLRNGRSVADVSANGVSIEGVLRLMVAG